MTLAYCLGSRKKVDPDKFKETYEGLLDAVRFMCSKASAAMSGYEVAELELALGVSAEGGLGFIAKAGVTADVTLTIRKKSAE